MNQISIKPGEPLAPPIFILSCERAGSTLLRYIIDTHSRICSPGELLLGRVCSELLRLLSRTLTPILPESERNRQSQTMAGITNKYGGAMGSDMPNETIVKETRQMISGIMNTYARAKGKEMWCDKTPWNLMYLDFLRLTFPDAKYICLHRNCMDVVHSCLETSKHGFIEELVDYALKSPGNLVAAMIDSWVDKTNRLLMFEAQNPSQCFRIKYESFVSKPAETLPDMFRFLGAEWEPGILSRIFHSRHDQGGGDEKVEFTKKIDKANIGKGGAIRLSDIPYDRLVKMNEILGNLDYPKVTREWDDAPSPYRLDDGDSPAITTVRDIFIVHMPSRFKSNETSIRSINGSYKFVITGSEQCRWLVDLKGSQPRITETDGNADCVIILDTELILDIANERVNALTAFMDGKIKLDGRQDLASKIGEFL
ncbi:MAG: hypothetical protein GY940_46445 [bacterium]|nr:hypothetical protein [bacterium]